MVPVEKSRAAADRIEKLIYFKQQHMKLLPVIFFAFFFSIPALAQKPVKLVSPDGNLQFVFKLPKTGPVYDINYKGRAVITGGELSLRFAQEGIFKNDLKTGKPIVREGEEKYSLIIGKTSNVQERYRELVIPLEQTKTPFRKLNIVVRAFNDGIAFRYEFPEQNNFTAFTLAAENSTFPLPASTKTLALFFPNFTSSHEGLYHRSLWSEVKEDTLIDLPVLFELPGIYLAITEAALTDYAGMYLVKKNGIATSKLSPFRNDTGIAVKHDLPHHSPWRVLMISDRAGALIESNLLTNLSPPCRIDDLSWIKPGITTWPWWNGNVIPDTIAGGNNFETNQHYIDFCARNGIEFHSVVEYGLHEWYVNDGAGFSPGRNADPSRAVPGLNMQQVCDYARQKGVGIRVWVHWRALYPKLDTTFAQYEKWGIKGLMVDFMDRDDQEMVKIQEEILQKAAKHKLHIQFHGAYKPTGMTRTWPNEFTREGVLNYEYNKWDNLVTPDHDVNVAFTRLLAGSTDYHLGGFRAVPSSKFRPQYSRPFVIGTRCHMLAMFVVLENALGMTADFPSAYEGQPGFEFIQQVPTTWDETKVPDAKVGEYVTVARRKNNEWWVGSITNNQAKEVKIPLSFLGNGEFEATMYTDVAGADANQLKKETRTVRSTDVLSVQLEAGGGMVMRLRSKN
jgi:alpha-glucosidase